ncbi:MAG: hypothetical protein WB660_17505 [Candidatus Sulfotelmatobacter sp.]
MGGNHSADYGSAEAFWEDPRVELPLDSLLPHFVGSLRIFGQVKARNTNTTRNTGNFHEGIEQWRFNIGLLS